MLKKQVGPFEFHKTLVKPGNGRIVPNDFTKCHVRLTLESYRGMSNEDILSNVLAYVLDCDIDVTIGLGERYFDCAVDLCLQKMVEGETAQYRISRIPPVLKTKNVQRNNEIIPVSNSRHSDFCATDNIISESIEDGPSNGDKVEVVPTKKDKYQKNYNAEETSTHIEIPSENSENSNSKDDVNSFAVGDCDASKTTISNENTTPPIQSFGSSCLIINVTLISFASASEVHCLVAEELLRRSSLLKDIGVTCFRRSDIPTAFYKFSRSLKYLLVCTFEETETELFKAWNLLRCQCYLNMAACQLQQEHFSSAKLNCSRALELDSNNVKGLFRRAQASMKLDEHEEARTDLERAFALEPSNTAVVKSLNVVQNVLKSRDKKLGDAMSKLFN